MSNTVIFVDLKKSRLPLPQKWRWVAKSAANNRKIATSGEAYTNYADAVAAVRLVFGDQSTVYLRQDGQGNQILRTARPL